MVFVAMLTYAGLRALLGQLTSNTELSSISVMLMINFIARLPRIMRSTWKQNIITSSLMAIFVAGVGFALNQLW